MDIYFELCKDYDFEFFYELKVDEENIVWTGHSNPPIKNKLKKWFLEQLERNDRYMFIVKSPEYPNDPVGYLYLDIVGENNNVIETGHGVNSKFKGRGIGTKIIKFAIDYTTNNLIYINRVDGWIAENNIGSINNVLKNGYIETSETKRVFFESINKNVNMRKFCYNINRQ